MSDRSARLAAAAAARRESLFSTLADNFQTMKPMITRFTESLITNELHNNAIFTINPFQISIMFRSDMLFDVIHKVLNAALVNFNIPIISQNEFDLQNGDSQNSHYFLTQILNKFIKLVKYTRNRKNPRLIYSLFVIYSILNVIHRVISEHIEQNLDELAELLGHPVDRNDVKTSFIDIDTRKYSRIKKNKHTPQHIGLNVLIHAYFISPFDYPFSFEMDDIQAEELRQPYLRNDLIPSLQISILNFVSFMWLINPYQIQPNFSINRTANAIRANIWGDEYLADEKRKFYNMKTTYLADYYED